MGPMSRWVSLNQARAKASANWSGFAWKRLPISSYAGSKRSARSEVNIMGRCFLSVMCASGTLASTAIGVPLPAAAGAFAELPLVVVEVVEVLAVPLDGLRGPRAFEARGDGVLGVALALGVLPAEALLLDGCAFGLGSDVGAGIVRTVALAEGVAAGDQREGLLVVHGHAAEGLADVACRSDRIGLAVGAFRVDVDETHLHGGERVIEITLTLVTVAAEPRVFRAPEDVFLRNPDVGASAAEAEGLEAHGVERDVAGKDHEVGPGDLLAVLLLDGPEQAAGLVEADVVGPAVERSKTLRAHARAAAAIIDAVGAGRCAMPCG